MQIGSTKRTDVSFQRKVPTEDYLRVLLHSKGYKDPSISLTFQTVFGRTIPSATLEDEIAASTEKLSRKPFFKKIGQTYRDWETDRKSTRLNSSHITRARMPSSA